MASCKQPGKQTVTIRDTTITQQNAFSELFLDSADLEKHIAQQQLPDTIANRMRSFYNSRNYQFAWFTNDGLAEQAHAFWNLHNNYINLSQDSTIGDKQLHDRMVQFSEEDSLMNADKSEIIETEFLLTRHFFDYAQYAYAGTIDPSELQWHIPRKKINVMVLLDSLVASKGQNIDAWEPVNEMYKRMRQQLLVYRQIEQSGGWDSIPVTKKSIVPGDSGRAVLQLKKRLIASHDYTATDTSALYSKALNTAVQQMQKRFGFAEDGKVLPELVKQLNVSVTERIKQVLINMERIRWMPKEASGVRLVANIPEYKLHVLDGKKEVFNIDIVVGKTANKTVIFNDQLKYVVFSPYWNIPRSIVRNEILPAMQKNSNYLRVKNMEQTGFSNGLPIIRQKPGGSNALGKVKFIFPNNYNIYFHDTPAKTLFNKRERAFSHGCIRVAEPFKLAAYLLQDQPAWTQEKIAAAMNASKELWVPIQQPVPVVITYFTAWIDGEGLLNLRDDVYGLDNKLAERLFENLIP